jgi:hypothetical protein
MTLVDKLENIINVEVEHAEKRQKRTTKSLNLSQLLMQKCVSRTRKSLRELVVVQQKVVAVLICVPQKEIMEDSKNKKSTKK